MWFGECRPGSERQVKLWGIQLTFGFYSDWTQLVFIDPERERLWVPPWHCTSLAHPFIGCERHDICTICHHIKMDDHLHSYSHTNPSDQKPVMSLCQWAWKNMPFSNKHTLKYCFFSQFLYYAIESFPFWLFIKPFSSWNKWPCGDKHTHFCVCINPCFVMKILYLT